MKNKKLKPPLVFLEVEQWQNTILKAVLRDPNSVRNVTDTFCKNCHIRFSYIEKNADNPQKFCSKYCKEIHPKLIQKQKIRLLENKTIPKLELKLQVIHAKKEKILEKQKLEHKSLILKHDKIVIQIDKILKKMKLIDEVISLKTHYTIGVSKWRSW